MGRRAVKIRRQVELRTWKGRSLCSDTSGTQLRGYQLPLLTSKATGFDRFEFKFRPKRSDFGRKKLRTAETAVGFRLSEVVLSPGRRGGKLGGLQQALRRTPVFYPYRADSQSGPFGRGVGLPILHGHLTSARAAAVAEPAQALLLVAQCHHPRDL